MKSMKKSVVKTKRRNLITCHVQLLFQAATEGYSTYLAVNNTLPTMAPFNPCGTSTLEKKSRND